MLTEQDYTAAAERHLDMVYRVALNWLRSPADAEDALALSGQGDDGQHQVFHRQSGGDGDGRGQNDHGYDARFSQHGGYLLLIG